MNVFNKAISNEVKIAFFGTSRFSVIVLEEMKRSGFTPALIITAPDKPKGRKLVLTPPPVKVWAEENKVNFIQPEKLDETINYKLQATSYDLFVVASYGKMLKKELLEIPKHKTINVHPSLLPKLRGASPIQSAILEDEKVTGVTIMLVDEGMDSGPILDQISIETDPWPLKASKLEELLAREGGKLLAEVIPEWINGKITPIAQDPSKATYTKKIKKEDGLIDLSGDSYQNLLKIRAFDEWPTTYFFTPPRKSEVGQVEKDHKKIRVKITDADFEDKVLKIKKVIPEGKKEMNYDDFLRGK